MKNQSEKKLLSISIYFHTQENKNRFLVSLGVIWYFYITVDIGEVSRELKHLYVTYPSWRLKG